MAAGGNLLRSRAAKVLPRPPNSSYGHGQHNCPCHWSPDVRRSQRNPAPVRRCGLARRVRLTFSTCLRIVPISRAFAGTSHAGLRSGGYKPISKCAFRLTQNVGKVERRPSQANQVWASAITPVPNPYQSKKPITALTIQYQAIIVALARIYVVRHKCVTWAKARQVAVSCRKSAQFVKRILIGLLTATGRRVCECLRLPWGGLSRSS